MNRAFAYIAVAALLSVGLPALAGQKFIVAQQEHSGRTPTPPVTQKIVDLSCEQAQQPAQTDLDDYLGVHFDALQAAPLAFPAHALNKLKAAAGPVS